MPITNCEREFVGQTEIGAKFAPLNTFVRIANVEFFVSSAFAPVDGL
ncbi:hypothetical protein [Burkholderia ambifaria]|nr:hypothetical protein [Burkholderia ambifaria]